MKRRTFISLMGVMAAAGVLSMTGCSSKDAASSTAGPAPLDKLSGIRKSGKLVVALEGAWQPWSYHDSSDTLVGYDVEVSRAIAEKLGVEPEYVESDWDSLFAGLDAGRYDMVCNGIEVGGGSIRIHDAVLQAKIFKVLGFTPERAQEQFGFLMNAFKYGAPPHGGLAYGLDRWVSIFAGLDSIRDCIAFPKNNSGRDVMLDAPSRVDQKQLDELEITLAPKA